MQIIKNKTEDFLKDMAEIHSDFAGIDIKYTDGILGIFLWFKTFSREKILHSGIIIHNKRNEDVNIAYTMDLSESIKDKKDILIEKVYEFIRTIEEESGFPLYYLKADVYGKFTVKVKNASPVPQDIADIFHRTQNDIRKNDKNLILRGILYETYGNVKIEIQRYDIGGDFYEPEFIDTAFIDTELREYFKLHLNGFDGVCLLNDQLNLHVVNYLKKDIG